MKNEKFEKMVLRMLIRKVRCDIMGKRYCSTTFDFDEAFLNYQDMVFYATDKMILDKEYRICKHNFEQTFKKELSERGVI